MLLYWNSRDGIKLSMSPLTPSNHYQMGEDINREEERIILVL